MKEAEAGTLETRADAGPGDAGIVKLWLDAIELQSEVERPWRKKADEVTERYRDEKERQGVQFNILHSNIATLAPALYNSTPQPDVRRRFRDADPIGKYGAQILERGLSFSIDAYDFDAVMQGVVHDSLLPGRGTARVRYVPTLQTVQGDKPTEEVAWEEASCELVDWKDLRLGPGRRWEELPWIAFQHRLTREESVKAFGDLGKTVTLDFVMDGAEKKEAREIPDTFKRLSVWEIWDKQQREIVFIANSYRKAPLKREKDTLGLRGFFPIPRPVYDLDDPNSTVPMVPYKLYEDQAKELDRLTKRINALIAVIKWRGITAADATAIASLAKAADGDLVPVDNLHQVMAEGGIDKAVWLMPIEQAVKVVEQLYIAREQVKQTIFEITGVADIMRGQTDPNETLGAQQLKTQWGSLRLQKRQKEVQRFARDIMRMKAEIMAEKFSPQTLVMMTGVKLPSQQEKQAAQQQLQMMQQQAQQGGQQGQPPQIPPRIEEMLKLPALEDVIGMIKQDASRSYQIDIETDSTIQADQMVAQKNMGEFVQGAASFMQAFGEAVQTGQVPADVAVDLLTGFTRNFKLGKQAEDAMDRWSEQAQQASQQPKPPSPEEIEAQAKQQELKMQGEQAQAKHGMEMQKMQREGEFQQAEHAMKLEEMRASAQNEREKARTQMIVERNKAVSSVIQSKAKAEGAVASEGAKRKTEQIKQAQLKDGDKGTAAPVPESEDDIPDVMQVMQDTAEQVKQMAGALAQLVPAVTELVKQANAPRTIVKQGGRMVAAKIGDKVRPISYGADGSLTIQ